MVEGLYAAMAQLVLSAAIRKPRIYRSPNQSIGRQWVCVGSGSAGFGCTPADAYAEWAAAMETPGYDDRENVIAFIRFGNLSRSDQHALLQAYALRQQGCGQQ